MDINKDIEKRNNFKVPENYFDYLPQEIMERVHTTSERKPFFVLRPALSFASLLLLSAVAVFLIYTSQHPAPSNKEYVLNENDIQYVIDNSSLYIDAVSITDDYLSSVSEITSSGDESVSEEDITTYLEENMNANYIINEL